MKKIREALHRHHTNVPPSAAQATPYPSTASTVPGSATEPVLGGPSLASTGLASSTATTSTMVEQERVVVEETRSVPTIVEEFPVTPVVTTAPALVEHREKAPVVQEVIRPGVREEIQPVVHREREQLEIREEIQPIYETSVRPTLVEEMQLAPQINPEVRTGVMPVIAEGPRSNVVMEQEHVEVITNAPILEEVVHKRIIEEVQPVIQRETIAPKIIKEVQPIYEKVIEAPVVTYQTLPPVYATAPVVTPSVEQVTTTTTVVEKEFIPSSTTPLSTGTVGTTTPLSTTTPLTTGTGLGSSTSPTGLGTSPLITPTLGTGLGTPMMSSTPTSGLGTSPTDTGFVTTTTTSTIIQDMNALKLEEQQLMGQQPPSSFLNK